MLWNPWLVPYRSLAQRAFAVSASQLETEMAEEALLSEE